MTDLNFHVRHEVTPGRVWDVLTAVVEGYPINHIVQSDRQLTRLKQLRLLDTSGSPPKSSDLGVALYRVGQRRLDTAMDLLHYLHYTLWHRDMPLENALAWSYRAHCDMLFDRIECFLDDSTMNALTAELNHLANETFRKDIARTKKGAVSLSTNSIKGVHHWLRALVPGAIDGDKFSLRFSCSPEQLLLAVDWLVKGIGAELRIDFPLTPENRDILCRICLLRHESLDGQLDWMLPLYPTIIQPGTSTGGYGRHVRLLKHPSFKDLAE